MWTLEGTCFQQELEAQCAFKILMIHEVLHITLRIAFRCVLHRCRSLDIHRWKLCLIILYWLAIAFVRTNLPRLILVFVQLSCVRQSKWMPGLYSLCRACDSIWIWTARFAELIYGSVMIVTSWTNSWRDNDPSAGSPTETLLRLHLPLSDKV